MSLAHCAKLRCLGKALSALSALPDLLVLLVLLGPLALIVLVAPLVLLALLACLLSLLHPCFPFLFPWKLGRGNTLEVPEVLSIRGCTLDPLRAFNRFKAPGLGSLVSVSC